MFLKYKGRPEVELSGNLAGKSLFGQILTLALWPFIQNLMATTVGFVDLILAGRLGRGDVRGFEEVENVPQAMIEMMGPIAYVMWIMIVVQASIATGGQALVARANGAKDRELAERGFGQSVTLGFLSGCGVGLIIYLLRDFIIGISSLSEVAETFIFQYIGIIAFSAPLSGTLLVVNSCLRASGDTVRPFYAMCLVNGVNALVSYYLVYGPGSLGGHGAYGLAIGTVVGWAVGIGFIYWIIKGDNRVYSIDEPMVLKRWYLVFEKRLAWRVMSVALPNTLELLGMCIIHIIGFIMVGKIGLRLVEETGAVANGAVIGAHSMAIRVESFSFMPGFALGMAAATLAGQYLGAGSKTMAKKAVRVCCGIAFITMGAAGCVMFFCAERIVGVLDPNWSMQGELAVDIVRIFAFAQPFFAIAMVMKMSMRGAGATKIVMLSSFSSMFLIRICVLGGYVFYYKPTIQGAWFIMQIDLVIQAVLFLFLHYRGKWLNAQV